MWNTFVSQIFPLFFFPFVLPLPLQWHGATTTAGSGIFPYNLCSLRQNLWASLNRWQMTVYNVFPSDTHLIRKPHSYHSNCKEQSNSSASFLYFTILQSLLVFLYCPHRFSLGPTISTISSTTYWTELKIIAFLLCFYTLWSDYSTCFCCCCFTAIKPCL